MRRLRWLVLAALLLAATATLFALGEGEAPAPARARVQYPEWFNTEQYRRKQARATLRLPAPAPPPGVASGPAPEEEPPPRRDPFLVALPVKPGSMVMVFEANALRHSVLGERFLACLEAHKPGDIDRIQQDTGIDPLKDIDRVGYTDEAVVMSGFFEHLQLQQVFPTGPEAYGQAGRLYSRNGRDWAGTWGTNILVLGDTREAVQRAVDQLEGRVPVPDSGLSEDTAYGEVYGVIPGAAARRLVGADDRGIGRRLGELAERVELHVDAMNDVAAVARVRGADTQGLGDLAKSMGAALAVARVKAQADGETELADLLENAEVRTDGAGFSLQLAVPAAQLEKWFGTCGRPPAQDGLPGPGSTSTPGR